jgi:hypothetical protein
MNGNWDRGRTIPFLGTHKWDFHCSAWFCELPRAFANWYSDQKTLQTQGNLEYNRRWKRQDHDISHRVGSKCGKKQ